MYRPELEFLLKTEFWFWLFLISVPFGTRILLFQFTPGFDEYEAGFLYVSDIFMLVFLTAFLFSRRYVFKHSNILQNVRMFRWLGLFLFFAGLSVFWAPLKLLAFYNLIRLALLVLAALAVGGLIRAGVLKLEKILAVIAGLGVAESLIGFFQFSRQEGLGLWFLGESVLGPAIKGVAKIDVGSEHFLRAYGTFPHPNVLAAFLLLGLFSVYYSWLKYAYASRYFPAGPDKSAVIWRQLLRSVTIGAALFIILLGLVLTFSRAGWLVAIILSGIFILYFVFDRNYRSQSFRLLILLFVASYSLLVIFGWAILPRSKISPAEPAVVQRLSYNAIGWELLKAKPLGVGLGNQVIYSVKNGVYQDAGLNQAWRWQPIHNLYLLIGSEIGVLGLFGFLVFLAKLLISNFQFSISKKIPNSIPTGYLPKGDNDQNSKRLNFWDLKRWNLFGVWDLEIGVSQVMLLALLGFGFFDHFLWTLQPGRLMFWLIAGLLL